MQHYFSTKLLLQEVSFSLTGLFSLKLHVKRDLQIIVLNGQF